MSTRLRPGSAWAVFRLVAALGVAAVATVTGPDLLLQSEVHRIAAENMRPGYDAQSVWAQVTMADDADDEFVAGIVLLLILATRVGVVCQCVGRLPCDGTGRRPRTASSSTWAVRAGSTAGTSPDGG
jgi:hypothetical protein